MFCTQITFPITQRDLEEVFRIKHEGFSRLGRASRLRLRFNYFNPDEYYEAVVEKLITGNCTWLDVGCGRYVFPSNVKLAQILAKRCSLLVGVDPDETINENILLHSRNQTTIDNFRSDRTFDVVTLRMVAEHIDDPRQAVASLARLTRPGGKVVIYTVNRWSPVPIITWITPFKLHHSLKRLLWEGEEAKDTFPVRYRMNTRTTLVRLFREAGFREKHFAYLDDLRTFSRFRATLFLELCAGRILRSLKLTYPENCLLGIYERI